MKYMIVLLQAVISAAGVLVLRANLDGFDFRNPGNTFRQFLPILLGIFLYGISFLMWLVILSRLNVSIAYPLTIGLTLIFTIWGANLFLKESLSFQSSIGVALIAIGVIVAGSKGV